MVNLCVTWLFHGIPRHLAKHYSGCLCEDVINIWIGRPSKADYPPWCMLASSNQLKIWIQQKVWVRGPLHWLLDVGHWSFPAFELTQKHWHFFGLEPASFYIGTFVTGCPGFQTFGLRLELHNGSPRSPVYWLQILGFLSLHNCMSVCINF